MTPQRISTSRSAAIVLAVTRALRALEAIDCLRPEDEWRCRTTTAIALATARDELEHIVAVARGRQTAPHAPGIPKNARARAPRHDARSDAPDVSHHH